jgi:hypothetical protein
MSYGSAPLDGRSVPSDRREAGCIMVVEEPSTVAVRFKARNIFVPSSPGTIKNFLFSMSSRLVLGPTELPIQWVPGVKRPGREANHTPPTSSEAKKNVDLYVHSPIRLHGTVLN